MAKLPIVFPAVDKSIVSVIFPFGVDREFLSGVRGNYGINRDYGVLGLDHPIVNGGEDGGYIVIFYRRK